MNRRAKIVCTLGPATATAQHQRVLPRSCCPGSSPERVTSRQILAKWRAARRKVTRSRRRNAAEERGARVRPALDNGVRAWLVSYTSNEPTRFMTNPS